MRQFIAALAILLCAVPAFAGDATQLPMPPQYDVNDGRILVPGVPPLNVGVYHMLLNSVEGAWTLALTDAEQERVRVALMQDCLDRRPALFTQIETLRQIWQRGATEPKAGVTARLLRDALEAWLKEVPQGKVAGVLHEITTVGGEAAIPGQPVITRRCVQALGEILRFAFVLRDQRVAAWNADQERQFESRVVALASKFSPTARQWLANADYQRHLLRRGWREIDAGEKEAVRKLIIAALAPAEAGTAADIDVAKIELPPPNFFSLPRDLPGKLR